MLLTDNKLACLRASGSLQPNLSVDAWIWVLRTSTRRKMHLLRKLAVQKLDTLRLVGIWLIKLGKECTISRWARAGYGRVVNRDSSLSAEEVEFIGVGSAVKISDSREMVLANYRQWYMDVQGVETRRSIKASLDLFSEDLPSDNHCPDLVDRFLLAQKGGSSDFLLSCYQELVQRKEPLVQDEVKKLGVKTASKLWAARFSLLRAFRQDVARIHFYATMIGNNNVTAVVDEVFRDELAAIKLAEDTLEIDDDNGGKIN
jgi:hypothetical protein